MKTQIISTLLVLSSLSFKVVAAEAKPLPPVQAPRELVEVGSEFMEGTVTRLTADDVAQFLPWAQNAQKVLNKALVDIESMPIDQQVRHLTSVMQSVVRRSGSKTYQMFMRFALNRGMLLSQELLKEADVRDPGTLENALDLQVKTIKIALQAYESDLSYQRRVEKGEATTELNYANFGLNFARAMFKGIDSVFDASAQYRLLYKTLEMANWDLSRDSSANQYADTIIDIYNTLSVMNEAPANDDRSNITDIRRLNILKEVLANSENVSFDADYSAGGEDLNRGLRTGEYAIYGEYKYKVMGSDARGEYALQYGNSSSMLSNVSRKNLFMTSGCYKGLCVGEKTVYGEYQYTVAGISPAGKFAIQYNSSNSHVSNVTRENLAKAKGCMTQNYSNICVGKKAIYGSYQYTVSGFFPTGEVALRYGSSNSHTKAPAASVVIVEE